MGTSAKDRIFKRKRGKEGNFEEKWEKASLLLEDWGQMYSQFRPRINK
jgi:hypothetical protein